MNPNHCVYSIRSAWQSPLTSECNEAATEGLSLRTMIDTIRHSRGVFAIQSPPTECHWRTCFLYKNCSIMSVTMQVYPSTTLFTKHWEFIRQRNILLQELRWAVRLSLSLSVRPSVNVWQNEKKFVCILIPCERSLHLALWHEEWLMGTPLSTWHFGPNWPTPFENGDLLQHICWRKESTAIFWNIQEVKTSKLDHLRSDKWPFRAVA